MRTVLILACLSAVSILARASEIVTLSADKRSISVAPSDIVQVVSVLVGGGGGSVNYCDFNMAGGSGSAPYLYIGGQAGSTFEPGIVLTGLSSVSLRASDRKDLVTLRITKPNEGFVSESLVVPVAQGTTYAVALETSTNMQNWVPANPGDYVSTSSVRFFRVKAAVSPGNQ